MICEGEFKYKTKIHGLNAKVKYFVDKDGYYITEGRFLPTDFEIEEGLEYWLNKIHQLIIQFSEEQ